ncbi:type I restriction endonuclease [Brevundimonas subvibrioides]|uniref:type I restriction endonuclease n=1 Tax=Brevundimonas subvibrioides TaxID=74313 RepID=UPI0022B592B8|nr:type I restriction endonuclease [Brevundimonas subvibrioides]
MPYVLTTKTTPEQEFEAELRAKMLKAFPWLPPKALKHQRSFTFKAGLKEITVNGEPKTEAGARLDILVELNGKPLAILELKRPGERLTAADAAQARSYAKLVEPMAPLVALTNGTNTAFFDTYTGQAWVPDNPDEAKLAALIANAATLAKADFKAAIEQLMADAPEVWMSAVRQVSTATLDEMTGEWNDPTTTFVEGWGFDRRATQRVNGLLREKARLVMVEGEPLAGKSHVLRELVQDLADDEAFAALYVQADSGADLFQMLADLLSSALDWPLTRDDARHWLQIRARAAGPVLVLVLDHVGRGDGDLRKDIEALTSNAFGPGVRVVLAIDDGAAGSLLKKATGRGSSALAPRASRVAVGPLDDGEFQAARRRLSERRIGLMAGARYSAELRHPWVLRVMANEVFGADEYRDETLSAALSPLPGLDLLDSVREDFDTTEPPYALYRALAKAVLADLDAGASIEHRLQLGSGYIARRDTVNAQLADHDVRALEAAGLITPGRSEDGEIHYAIRLPQLLASELARLIAERLASADNAPVSETVNWLLGTTGGLFLGDAIGAQALIDAALKGVRLSADFITSLVNRPPVRKVLAPGTRVGGWMDGLGVITMTLLEAGAVQFEKDGHRMVAEVEPGEPTEHVAWNDFQPWLILSRLAGRPFFLTEGQTVAGRGDFALLLHVGACPTVLVEPGGDVDLRSLPTHQLSAEVSILCHDAGLAEPITWSLFGFLSRDWEGAGDRLIDEALTAAAPGLLARLDVALREVADLAGDERKAWAKTARSERVAPALKAAMDEAGQNCPA